MPDPTLFVNADKLPLPRNHYVAWLDVMGVQSIMSRSLPISANFILKFHLAALSARQTGVELFPVMDGLYAVAAEQEPLKVFLRRLYHCLAQSFSSTAEDKHVFVVRGGLAYGPIVKGADVPPEAAPGLASESAYARTLLLGMPVIQAHVGEAQAPPFGVFVGESARAFAPAGAKPFNEVWWRWFEPSDRAVAKKLRKRLSQYYAWCESNSRSLLYDSARIEAHRSTAEQFLPE